MVVVVEMENQPFEGGKGIYSIKEKEYYELRVYIHRLTA